MTGAGWHQSGLSFWLDETGMLQMFHFALVEMCRCAFLFSLLKTESVYWKRSSVSGPITELLFHWSKWFPLSPSPRSVMVKWRGGGGTHTHTVASTADVRLQPCRPSSAPSTPSPSWLLCRDVSSSFCGHVSSLSSCVWRCVLIIGTRSRLSAARRDRLGCFGCAAVRRTRDTHRLHGFTLACKSLLGESLQQRYGKRKLRTAACVTGESAVVLSSGCLTHTDLTMLLYWCTSSNTGA